MSRDRPTTPRRFGQVWSTSASGPFTAYIRPISSTVRWRRATAVGRPGGLVAVTGRARPAGASGRPVRARRPARIEPHHRCRDRRAGRARGPGRAGRKPGPPRRSAGHPDGHREGLQAISDPGRAWKGHFARLKRPTPAFVQATAASPVVAASTLRPRPFS